MAAALVHLSLSRGGRELGRLCEFLTEKIEECVLSSRGSCSLSYRSYFRVASELLNAAEGSDFKSIFDFIVPNLIHKVRKYNHFVS